LHEPREEKSQSLNYQSESQPFDTRGHVALDISIQKYDALEDFKSYALKSPEDQTPEVIVDH
jgi:hypothetical protein